MNKNNKNQLKPTSTLTFFILVYVLFFYQGPKVLAESFDISFQDLNSKNYYNNIIEVLKPGDTVKFSDGHLVKIGNFIDKGHNTRIYEIENNPKLVLRIPKWSFSKSYITETHAGYNILFEYGIPMIKIYNFASSEYVIVDRLDSNIKNFIDLVNNKINLEQKNEMIKALKLFARQTALFQEIGDFRIDQLAYDTNNKKWILFDWSSKNHLAFKITNNNRLVFSTKTAFDSFFLVNILTTISV